MIRCRLVDATALPTYDLGANHPFARDRQEALFDLLRRHGLFTADEILVPEPADDAVLQTAHTRDYIDAVRALSAPRPPFERVREALRFGFGNSDNPITPGQHEAARAIAGATRGCVAEVMAGRATHAFNPAGGLHHAMPAAAQGFCVYNDLVIGIAEARRLGAAKVLYVDFDVHHGDGVELAFRRDAAVMTISFHEDPAVRYPGTGWVEDIGEGPGRGTAINVPLASYTADASWLQVVRDVLPPLARRFRPDLIVSQHGCDAHRDDPLAELHLTTGALHEAARLTRALALELCDGRWVATGGGGYQPVRVIPRVWGAVWAIMSGRSLPERIDPGWLAHWQTRAPGIPATFTDEPRDDPRHARAAHVNEQTVARLWRVLDG